MYESCFSLIWLPKLLFQLHVVNRCQLSLSLFRHLSTPLADFKGSVKVGDKDDGPFVLLSRPRAMLRILQASKQTDRYTSFTSSTVFSHSFGYTYVLCVVIDNPLHRRHLMDSLLTDH
jgi:hypothetical protein